MQVVGHGGPHASARASSWPRRPVVAERSNERVADDLVAATRAMCLRGIQSQLSPCSCADRKRRN